MFSHETGNYGGAVCASVYLPTKTLWYPSVIRFNPYDGYVYVSEVDISSVSTLFSQNKPVTILKFEDVCVETTDVFHSTVPASGTYNDKIVDFAFGDENTMYVLVEPALTIPLVVYKSTNHQSGPSSFTMLAPPPETSHWTGIEGE